jgi:hypothetical protein
VNEREGCEGKKGVTEKRKGWRLKRKRELGEGREKG